MNSSFGWTRKARTVSLALAFLGGSAGFAPFLAKAQEGGGEVLTAAVGEHLTAAQKALAAHKFPLALQETQAASRVTGLTGYDRHTILQMQAAIYARSGNARNAVSAYSALMADPLTSKAEKLQLLLAEASLAYGAKDYPACMKAAGQYLKLGGSNATMETLLVQCPYLQKDWSATIKAGREILALSKARKTAPPEGALQMMGAAARAAHDPEASRQAYVGLVSYYSRPQYWQILFHDLSADSVLSPRLVFNLQRLRMATGTLKDPADFQDMGERAIQMHLPQLAVNLLSAARAAKLWETGPDLEKQRKFTDYALADAKKVRDGLQREVEEAEAEPSRPSLSLTAGYNLVLNGEARKGLALMRQGLEKKLHFPDVAHLDYAMALMDSGDLKAARRAFENIPGTGSAHDFGQLWAAHLRH